MDIRATDEKMNLTKIVSLFNDLDRTGDRRLVQELAQTYRESGDTKNAWHY